MPPKNLHFASRRKIYLMSICSLTGRQKLLWQGNMALNAAYHRTTLPDTAAPFQLSDPAVHRFRALRSNQDVS
jgi:hypothetical protein